MGKKRRRWWRWAVALGMALVAIALGVCWLMFQHVPTWYRPPMIAPAYHQRVRDDLQVTFDAVQETVQHETRPVEHRFTQDQINAWLAISEAIWPWSREWLPPGVSDPFVAIDEDGVRLAVTYRHGGIRTVMSARLEITAETSGIRVRLAEVSTGQLNVPRSWVREQLAELDEDAWPAGKRSDLQHGGGVLPEIEGLFDGVVFPDTWVWKYGDKPFRITDVRFEPGAIAITFEPLPRQEARR